MRNILILADLTSPLMKPRILMLKELPYQKYILHNANNVVLNNTHKEGLEDFIILEHRKVESIRLRYLYSFFYTLFLILKLNPELIVVHWASRLYQNLLLALWGKRVIVHTMGGDIDKLQDYRGKKAFFIALLLKSCKVISVKSNYMESMLKEQCKNTNIVHISWGVEERFFVSQSKAMLQHKLFGKEFDCLFFSVRAFSEFYRQKEIIESFLSHFRENAHVALLVSTLRKDSQYFERVAVQNDNIYYREIPHEQMDSYLKASDYVVSFSKSDGMSQSLMEAKAAGVRIIANDLGNHSELLKDEMLFNDEESLKEAMVKAVNTRSQVILEDKIKVMLDCKQQKALYLETLRTQFGILTKESYV